MLIRVAWLAILSWLLAARGAAADQPQAVYLGPGWAWSIGGGDRPTFGFLTRELARQAFLIAAREECGVGTRDASLGDKSPASGDNPPFDLVCSAGKSSLLEILRGFDPAQKSIWREELDIGREFDYPAFVARMERMSRTEFVRVLEQNGFRRKPPRMSPIRGELPAETAKWLDELSFTSQFAALRQLHGLCGSDRDNPARLAGLARGYANLGMMSEYFWNPMHQVFKARALLYAERLVVVERHSPWALAYRAYARALVGLHAAALEDLTAAKADPKSQTADLPKWVDLLAGFCRFDAVAVKTAGDPAQEQLAALLRLAMAEQSAVPGLTPQTARAESLKVPECFRICDGYLIPRYYNHPDRNEEQPLNGSAVMGRTLYGRLQALSGLPRTVAKAAESYDSDEFARRQAVTHELLVAETPQSAVAGDEFSWRLLGRIVREISFCQAWREIRPGDENLAANDETIVKLRPLYAEHPYAAYLEMGRSSSSERQKAYQQLLKHLDAESLEFQHWPMFEFLDRFTESHIPSTPSFYVLMNRMDGVARDLARRIQTGPLPNDVESARVLLAISPYHPVARTMLIEHDWEKVRSEAADWEKTSRTQSAVLIALGKRAGANDPATAERLLRSVAEASPTAANLAALAAQYDRTGKNEEWLKTMKRLAPLPGVKDRGLVHELILQYYMIRGDTQNAAEQAAAAVETKTSAGLLGGAGFYESQQNWDDAETFYRQASEADPAVGFDWYYFCRRTRQGDEKAARKQATKWLSQREQMKNQDPQPFLYMLVPAATYYLLSDKPETARRYFTEEFERCADPFCGLHAALISDELKDAQIRDKMLADIVARHAEWVRLNPNRPYNDLVALAAIFVADLSKKGNSDLDFDAVNKLLSTGTEVDRINRCFFVGQYLYLHGKPDKAIDVWLKAMPLLPMQATNRTLAGSALAANGMTPNFYEDAMKKRTAKPSSNDAKSK